MMNNKESVNRSAQQQSNPPVSRPNETGSVSVMGFVRIFDPKTQEVLVETRS